MSATVKKIMKRSALLYNLNVRFRQAEFTIKSRWLDKKFSRNQPVGRFDRLDYAQKDLCTSRPINFIYVGTNLEQDHGGILNGLAKFGDVNVFYNRYGNYGLQPVTESSTLTDIARIKNENTEDIRNFILEKYHPKKSNIFVSQIIGLKVRENLFAPFENYNLSKVNICMDDVLPDLWVKNVNSMTMGVADIASEFDLNITTYAKARAIYERLKVRYCYFPLACSENSSILKSFRDRKIDLLFIGNRYGQRSRYVNMLESAGLKVECYGNGWENGYADREKSIALMENSKIVLGFSNVGHMKNTFNLKLRDFEAIGSGALYFTNGSNDLDQFFDPMVHYVKWSDENLVQRIRFALNEKNNSRIQEIVDTGNTLCRTVYTWENFIKNMIGNLKL